MTDLQSRDVVRLSSDATRRVFAFVRPRRLTTKDTAFEAGYERAKQDLSDILSSDTPLATALLTEKHPRAVSDAPRSLLSRMLGA